MFDAPCLPTYLSPSKVWPPCHHFRAMVTMALLSCCDLHYLLKIAYIAFSNLPTLPSQICLHCLLKSAYIAFSNLPTLPSQICLHYPLKSAYIAFSNLSTLPSQICLHYLLKSAHIAFSNLPTLPSQICRYAEGDKVAMNVGFYYMANAM